MFEDIFKSFLVAIFILIPGFVFELVFYRINFYNAIQDTRKEKPSEFDTAMSAFFFGTFCEIPFVLITLHFHPNIAAVFAAKADQPLVLVAGIFKDYFPFTWRFLTLYFFIVPSVCGLIFPFALLAITPLLQLNIKLIIAVKKLFKISSIKSPWDKLFISGNGRIFIIELRNGNKLAGFYGPQSCFNEADGIVEIYFEVEYEVNSEGIPIRIKDNSNGFWLSKRDILKIASFGNTLEMEVEGGSQ